MQHYRIKFLSATVVPQLKTISNSAIICFAFYMTAAAELAAPSAGDSFKTVESYRFIKGIYQSKQYVIIALSIWIMP